MNVYITTLGCRLNEAERQDWVMEFQKLGHQVVADTAPADVMIINTCAVTQEAVKKSRQLIRRLHRLNPKAKLVLSGCYPSLDKQGAEAITGVDMIIHNRDKQNLVQTVLSRPVTSSIAVAPNLTHPSMSFAGKRCRAFIKVQDGCRYRCSFCIVTVARELERSRSVADIVQQINDLAQQDIREVVLTGVHLGGYGHDIGADLSQLLKTILEYSDISRIRLGSLEPWEIPESFLLLLQNTRMMPHLHLPLQSGSDSVLRRMHRRCKTADFSKLVNQLRGQNANINLTTDIIVGFPGETEHEWQESLDYIQAIKFSHCHIFIYSKREGTKAADLPDQLPTAIKKQRSNELHEVSKSLRNRYLQQQLSKTDEVLWENVSQDGGITGYTSNYLKIRYFQNANKQTYKGLENTITPTRIIDLDTSRADLQGLII